jgi:hypothetical protein
MHREEMGLKGGADIIYDSESKLEGYHNDMKSTNYEKCLEEKHISNTPIGNTVESDDAPYHKPQEIILLYIVPVRLLFWSNSKII